MLYTSLISSSEKIKCNMCNKYIFINDIFILDNCIHDYVPVFTKYPIMIITNTYTIILCSEACHELYIELYNTF